MSLLFGCGVSFSWPANIFDLAQKGETFVKRPAANEDFFIYRPSAGTKKIYTFKLE